MAVVVLLSFSGEAKGLCPPLADLSLTPDLLAVLREYQHLQFHPRVVLATVREWVASGGGSPERVLGQLRAVGEGSDPHVLCFGPAPTGGSFTASRGRTPSCRTGSRRGGCTSTTRIIRETGRGS